MISTLFQQQEDFDLDMDFSKTKKKKKKKKDLDELVGEEVDRKLDSKDEGNYTIFRNNITNQVFLC